MEPGKHSHMAEGTAYLRAVHMSIDGEPKILEDPLAAQLLGPGLDDRIAAERERLAMPGLIKARSMVTMRSRYAEDELTAAIDRGVNQYVILGAGLDTSPYRDCHPANSIRIFEVDHPDTQSWKLEKLNIAGIQVPDNVHYVAVNFESDSLAERLTAGGFNNDEPAFISWLGVTYYLHREAILDIFKYVAHLPSPSQLVFDFIVGVAELSEPDRASMKAIKSYAEEYGEPWISQFEPTELRQMLSDSGFGETFHLSHALATRKYFEGRADGLYMDTLTEMMSAIV